MDANFLSILHQKNYFFYFTHQFLQNTHISLSILNIYLIKYSFFYNFLLFPHSLPLSLTEPTLPTITPYPATIITHPTTIIKESQPIQSDQIDPSTRKPTDQTMRNIGKPNHHPPETHWSNNEKQRKSEVIGEALWRSARDQWRWWFAVVARDQGLQEV